MASVLKGVRCIFGHVPLGKNGEALPCALGAVVVAFGAAVASSRLPEREVACRLGSSIIKTASPASVVSTGAAQAGPGSPRSQKAGSESRYTNAQTPKAQ
jgi:hypothetical protein